MIFETHAHYDDEQFNDDRDELIRGLLDGDICKIINVGASVEGTKASVLLAETYDEVYAAVGVHPSEVGELDEEMFSWLREQTKHPKVIAVGEIGLDYYWEKEQAVRKRQQYWFDRQLSLARECQLPVIIHSRDAAEDTLQVMRNAHAEKLRGVIHCYSYSPELAREFVQMGYYIGVGGVVTFKNAKKLKETVMQIPMERILLETDAPYLAPEPYRGKRNDSGKLMFVAQAIARLRGISVEEVITFTRKNAEQLFFA